MKYFLKPKLKKKILEKKSVSDEEEDLKHKILRTPNSFDLRGQIKKKSP